MYSRLHVIICDSLQNPPLYNKGSAARKRSLSENWLEHNPPDTVNNGDLLQPKYKKKKTVTNPKPKHFNKKKVHCSYKY